MVQFFQKKSDVRMYNLGVSGSSSSLEFTRSAGYPLHSIPGLLHANSARKSISNSLVSPYFESHWSLRGVLQRNASTYLRCSVFPARLTDRAPACPPGWRFYDSSIWFVSLSIYLVGQLTAQGVPGDRSAVGRVEGNSEPERPISTTNPVELKNPQKMIGSNSIHQQTKCASSELSQNVQNQRSKMTERHSLTAEV